MKRRYFYFLFLLTGIISALIAQSLSNNPNILSAYATNDKKYKDGYNEKNYDRRYDDDYKQTEYEKLKDNDRNIFYNQNFGYNDYSDDIYSDYSPGCSQNARMDKIYDSDSYDRTIPTTALAITKIQEWIKAMIQTHMTVIPTTAQAQNVKIP